MIGNGHGKPSRNVLYFDLSGDFVGAHMGKNSLTLKICELRVHYIFINSVKNICSMAGSDLSSIILYLMPDTVVVT